MTKMLRNFINTVKNANDFILSIITVTLVIIGSGFWIWHMSSSSYLDKISRYEELVEQLQDADEQTEVLTLARESDDVQYLYAVAKSDTSRGKKELTWEKDATYFQIYASGVIFGILVVTEIFIIVCWYQKAKEIEEANKRETVHRRERRLSNFRPM